MAGLSRGANIAEATTQRRPSRAVAICVRPTPSEQPTRRTRRRHAQVSERGQGSHAPAWGALQKALLDEVGFEDILDGVAGFTNGGCQIIDADRPPGKLLTSANFL